MSKSRLRRSWGGFMLLQFLYCRRTDIGKEGFASQGYGGTNWYGKDTSEVLWKYEGDIVAIGMELDGTAVNGAEEVRARDVRRHRASATVGILMVITRRGDMIWVCGIIEEAMCV
ncbi:hypothetical protein E2542_SST22426 [Spatholobus suberectus]|nr:hypothetical protein E2542_SST22426 [Spatholobus suberectus]